MAKKGKKKITNIKPNNVAIFLLLSGIAFIAISFISELNFHYLQGFMPCCINQQTFARAENAEVFNSMTFLIVGALFITMAIVIKVKRGNKS